MFPYSPYDMRSRCRSRKYSKILDLTVREHPSCFPFPNVLRFVFRVATQGLLFHWNGEFSSVCWFAVHILHCRLLIRKEPNRSACFFTSGHERNKTSVLPRFLHTSQTNGPQLCRLNTSLVWRLWCSYSHDPEAVVSARG